MAPLHEEIDADDLLVRRRTPRHLRQRHGAARAVARGREARRLPAEPGDHRVRERAGADFLRRLSFLEDVIGVDAVLDRCEPRVVYPLGGLGLPDVDEHHHAGEQQARRVCHVLTGAPRRRAVDRLEHGDMLADVRRGREAHRAGDLGGDVREDVAVEVRHHDDVELLRRVGELRRADVDDPVLLLELRILGADLVEDLVEEAVGELHDVVLGEAGHLAPAVGAGIFERIADDLLGAWPGNELQALEHLVGLPVLDAGIQVLFVLAHDHDVHLRMPGGDERRVRSAGPHVGVEPERLAHGDVEALEPAALGGGDRRLVEHARAPQRLPGAGLDSRADALRVDLLADLDRLHFELRAGGLQDAQGRGHDLRADAVAVGDRDRGRYRRRRRRADHVQGGGCVHVAALHVDDGAHPRRWI